MSDFIKFILFFIILVSSTTGCISEVEVTLSQNAPREYVISGLVTNEKQDHVLKVMQSHTIEGNQPVFAEAVDARLWDEDGNVFLYEKRSSGTFILPQFSAEVGKAYWVEIELPDGNTILSKPAKVPTPLGVDSTYYSSERIERLSDYGIAVKSNFVVVYLDLTLPSDVKNTYLRWSSDETFVFTEVWQYWLPFDKVAECYFHRQSDPELIPLLAGADFQLGPVKGVKIVQSPSDWTFWEKHSFNINQYTLNQDAYAYWQKAKGLVYQNGSIFDIQPGRLRGNLYMDGNPETVVHGFFEVSGHTKTRLFSYGVLLDPYYPVPICEKDAVGKEFGLPPYCYDCFQLEGASGIRPEYW